MTKRKFVMTFGRRRADSSQDDELVSRLYQQVTEQQAARFAAGYDMAAGLARYRAWLAEHTAEEQAEPPAVPGPMTTLPGFTVEINQNLYLPVGGQDVSAIVTVTASRQLPDVDDVALRVWTPPQVTVQFVKQVAPAVNDLTGRRRGWPGRQDRDYPTGAWAPGESRDYRVGVQVNAAKMGQVLLAARVSLVVSSLAGQQVLGQGLVRATWPKHEALPGASAGRGRRRGGKTPRRLARDQQLVQAIERGLSAVREGHEEIAAAWLGRAVALAHEGGHEDVAQFLAMVVDVVDEATGTVRLKKKVDAAAEIRAQRIKDIKAAQERALRARQTKTVRVKNETG